MQATAIVELLDEELAEKLALSRRELLAEHRQPHGHPWIIGTSDGAFEILMDLPRSERLRPGHIVANDTLVESPQVVKRIRGQRQKG